MSVARVVTVTLLAAGISVGTAIFGERWLARAPRESAGPPGGTAQLRTLPDFKLPDLSGREVLSNAWAGKVLVLNYWATWCASCVRELPLLIQTQEVLAERGGQVVGIAIDRAADVSAFVAKYPVNYPLLIGNLEAMELAQRLGNRLQGLPFTVIFDRQGRRVFSHLGEVGADQLQAQLDGLLAPAPAQVPPTDPGGAAQGSGVGSS